MAKMKTNEERKAELEVLTEQMEKQIDSYFESPEKFENTCSSSASSINTRCGTRSCRVPVPRRGRGRLLPVLGEARRTGPKR